MGDSRSGSYIFPVENRLYKVRPRGAQNDPLLGDPGGVWVGTSLGRSVFCPSQPFSNRVPSGRSDPRSGHGCVSGLGRSFVWVRPKNKRVQNGRRGKTQFAQGDFSVGNNLLLLKNEQLRQRSCIQWPASGHTV